MKHPVQTLRWLAVGFLVLWCGVFLRVENTEKSMVRALVLRPGVEGWTVGALYQFPEAAADASDASAELRSCEGTGETLEQAVREMERGLPKEASYRLCDYLLFDEAAAWSAVREVEQFVQMTPVSRLSARVFLLEETDRLETEAEQLLSCAEAHAACAPHLYEREGGLLLPVLCSGDETAALGKQGILLTAQGSTRLSAEETAAAWLLTGRSPSGKVELDGKTVAARRWIVSVEADGEAFQLRLSGQKRPGTPAASDAECRELEALCIRTAARCWDAGWDLLRLGAVRALQQGGPVQTPTKNACPELRADVSFFAF